MFRLAIAGLLLTGSMPILAQPTLTTPAHLGATRGKHVALVLAGTNLTGVTELRTSFPAKVTIPPGQKDATNLRVSLDVPADAPLGPNTIQVGSSKRPFAVDELPEVVSNGSNRSRAKAQVIPIPCVVVGAVVPDAGDCYRLRVQSGQAVTIDVLARRLGSELDPVLLIADGTGKELAGLAVDDTPGLMGDARTRIVPKEDGELVVEVRDTTHRGGDNFGYRLRVGDFPVVTAAFPLAVQRGVVSQVGFVGADGVEPVTMTAPVDSEVTEVFATPRRPGGLAGWPVPVRVSDHPEVVEGVMMSRVPVPGGVSARFGTTGERDVFVFSGRKGTKLAVRARGTEVQIRVLGPNGAELGKSDPTSADTVVEFAPPTDGDYRAECVPLNYVAGPAVVYHLAIGLAPEKEKKP